MTPPPDALAATSERSRSEIALAEALEVLAAIEHEQWEKWSREVAEQGLTPERIERWHRYWVPYADLDDATQEHDRKWARRSLAALSAAGWAVVRTEPVRVAVHEAEHRPADHEPAAAEGGLREATPQLRDWEDLPHGVYDGANRYDDDNEAVLHLWAHGQSWDLRTSLEVIGPVWSEVTAEEMWANYRGKWVAIDNDEIIASGDTATEAYEGAQAAGVEVPLLHRVPENGTLHFYGMRVLARLPAAHAAPAEEEG